MQEVLIKDSSYKIIGKIKIDENGNKRICDFYGKCLGTYDAKKDITRDFYGAIVAHGDASGMLISMNEANNNK